ncbi:unnamed protein product, partial [Phaeothamnion confervicola]
APLIDALYRRFEASSRDSEGGGGGKEGAASDSPEGDSADASAAPAPATAAARTVACDGEDAVYVDLYDEGIAAAGRIRGDADCDGGKEGRGGGNGDGVASGSDGGEDRRAAYARKAACELKTPEGLAASECLLCLDAPVVDPVLTPCGHCACRICLQSWVSVRKEPGCPACQHPLSRDDIRAVLGSEWSGG